MRTEGGEYEGFEPSSPWDTGDDNVAADIDAAIESDAGELMISRRIRPNVKAALDYHFDLIDAASGHGSAAQRALFAGLLKGESVTLVDLDAARAAEETGDPELAHLLAWSEAVNARVAQVAQGIPPFEWALEALARILYLAFRQRRIDQGLLLRSWLFSHFDSHVTRDGVWHRLDAAYGKYLGGDFTSAGR